MSGGSSLIHFPPSHFEISGPRKGLQIAQAKDGKSFTWLLASPGLAWRGLGFEIGLACPGFEIHPAWRGFEIHPAWPGLAWLALASS